MIAAALRTGEMNQAGSAIRAHAGRITVQTDNNTMDICQV
jgi:hypothetical protein